MMVAALTMGMTVTDLFGGRSAYAANVDFEVQVHTCQRVIGIQSDLVALDLDHLNDASATIGVLHLELGSDGKLFVDPNFGATYLGDQALVALTVTLACGDRYGMVGTLGGTLERFLQPANDLSMTVQVRKGLTTLGAIQHLAIGVGEFVVDRNDRVLGG